MDTTLSGKKRCTTTSSFPMHSKYYDTLLRSSDPIFSVTRDGCDVCIASPGCLDFSSPPPSDVHDADQYEPSCQTIRQRGASSHSGNNHPPEAIPTAGPLSNLERMLFTVSSVILLGVPYICLVELQHAWEDGLDSWDDYVRGWIWCNQNQNFVCLIFTIKH